MSSALFGGSARSSSKNLVEFRVSWAVIKVWNVNLTSRTLSKVDRPKGTSECSLIFNSLIACRWLYCMAIDFI